VIGEALRLIRVFHDKKSKDLAVELGISPSYLSEIENGHKRPSLELIDRYAEVFRTKPSVILFFAEELGQGRATASHAAARKKLLMFLKAVERFAHTEDEA
jgi:transcriptional regulator with XRE-family HTH domain